MADVLREYELRLLRCTLPSLPSCLVSTAPSPPSYRVSSIHTFISELVSSIETGHYVRAFSSEIVRVVFELPGDDLVELYDESSEGAGRFYADMMERARSFLKKDPEDEEKRGSYRVILVMGVAVAAFLAFTQCNLTGPYEKFPSCPLPFGASKGVSWDNWARNELISAGSDLLGKFSNLQYLVFSKMLLAGIKDLFEGSQSSLAEIRSMPWWLVRVILVHQRILEDRSSSLYDQLQVFMGETLKNLGTSEEVIRYWGTSLQGEEALNIITMLHLEAGIMEYTYARVDSCRKHLKSAEDACQLQFSVIGALGFRTIHQVEPKPQLVLVSDTTASYSGDKLPRKSCHSGEFFSNGEEHSCLDQLEACKASDVLMVPKLVNIGNNSGLGGHDSQNGGVAVGSLKPIQQAVILVQCLLKEKSSQDDEMQGWEMAPYIEAIDSQQSSEFILRLLCAVLRIRWESRRSRTKDRALLMMEKLVQSVYEVSPGVVPRIRLCYGVSVPTIPELRREYGTFLVSFGLIGEALKTFEDLELWDNLIYCYRLLEKKASAVELIQRRLSEAPFDPRLWCTLGEVTCNDSCYEKALEVSNSRSVRAKRSLARSAYNRGEYEASKNLWESAMALNSMYPDGWFALGAAALKAKDVERALDGFTRAVQLDPENGEAWNNIACLHMIRKKNKEALIAFREALKFKRNSWQLWENYSQVAGDVGNFGQSLEALMMVLDLTNNKRIDDNLLERSMMEIERRSPISLGFEVANSRETEHLMDLLGKVLQKIIRSGEGNVWGLYARWLKMKGDLRMCSEALLKQVRSYQGSNLWKETDRFKKFANASLELCKVYMEIYSSTGSRRELLAAEMHLKNIIKQGESFSQTQEFGEIQACLDLVNLKLRSLRPLKSL